MKKLTFLVVLFLATAVLFGCQPVNEAIEAEEPTNEIEPLQSVTLIDIGKIAQAEVAATRGVDPVVYEEVADLAAFDAIFSRAVKEPGIVNMAAPSIFLKLIDTEGKKQNLYAWIGDEGDQASLMRENDTHTVYSLSAEMTEKLAALVKK